jgi:ABC-type antimicrobial peptide transport system permease subunit
VFTDDFGEPLTGSRITERRLRPLLRREELPPIRFHDMRHTAATLMLSAGVNPKVVSLGSLVSSALLIAAILYGAVEERRREFGLRRSQGATRSTIGALVVAEASLLAVAGTTAGAVAASIAVAVPTATLPDPTLTFAIGALVTLSAVAGSIPPALSAALREPLYVLRSE